MTTDADDPLAPAVAGDDADDAAWLLARSRGDASAPARADAPRAYDQLEAMLGDLDPIAPPPDWQARVLAGADAVDAEEAATRRALDAEDATKRRAVEVEEAATRRAAARRRRWIAAGGAAVAVAAALALVMRPGRPGAAPPVEVAITRDGTPRGSGAAAVGDLLEVTGRLAGAGALRVYRDDAALIAECPRDGAPVCAQRTGDKLVVHRLAWPLAAPGRYRVVLFAGAVPASAGAYDADFRAARQAGAKIALPTREIFDVR